MSFVIFFGCCRVIHVDVWTDSLTSFVIGEVPICVDTVCLRFKCSLGAAVAAVCFEL